jgi:hypothetical protein
MVECSEFFIYLFCQFCDVAKVAMIPREDLAKFGLQA